MTATRKKLNLGSLSLGSMTSALALLLMVASLPAKAAASDAAFELIGYYPGWKSPVFPVNARNIDAKQLTVINYAFLDICWNGKHGNAASDAHPDGVTDTTLITPCKDNKGAANALSDGAVTFGDAALDPVNLRKLVKLKAANPALKIVPSVGGWVWSNRFSDMAEGAKTRANFVQSVLALMRDYKLDGIDLDWEYPTSIGIPCATGQTCQRPADKQNYVALAQKLRTAFDAAGAADHKHYIITIAAGTGASFVNDPSGSSDWIVQLANSLDWINIMTYDFHGPWDKSSGLVAPLHNDPADSGARSASEAVKIYLDAGVPSKKLTMGVPFYGYGWRGCAAGSGNGLYQACTGAATTGSDGSTFQFTFLVSQGYLKKDATGIYTIGGLGFTRYWNSASQVPYLYNAETKLFITYDDETSVHAKDVYLKSQGLRGGMFWELSGDSNRILGKVMAKDLLH